MLRIVTILAILVLPNVVFAGPFLEGFKTGSAGCAAMRESQLREPQQVTSQECSSDYNCSYGMVCVKAPLHFKGTCMKPVDEYGLPQYQSPDPDSLQIPTEPQCTFDTECPIGFECNQEYKVCVRR